MKTLRTLRRYRKAHALALQGGYSRLIVFANPYRLKHLTLISVHGKCSAPMWPDNLGRVFHGHYYPTCLENGSHRYLSPHAISKDRSTWYRVCRICKETIVMQFNVKDGQIVETVIKTSTPSKQIDKSTNENDVKPS